MTNLATQRVGDVGNVPRPRGELLVTGAAGFIGQHIALACHEAGWAVTALDIRTPSAAVLSFAHVIKGQADTSAVLRDLRAGRYAAAVHEAAITSTLETDWDLLREVNVRQSLAVADACAAGGATFIYASSHSVYGRIRRRVAVAEGAEHDSAVCTGPLNLYARSKLDLDLAMAERGRGAQPPWIGLRYTNVFGPGEQHKGGMASIISQLLRASAEGRQLRLFDDALQACRDYVPVQTVADVVLDLLERGISPGVYNLGSGCPVSFATVLDWCAEFAGHAPRVVLVPNPVPDRYQYWTCADLTRITRSLPAFTAPTTDGIRIAARQLFRRFQEAPAEEATLHGRIDRRRRQSARDRPR